MAEEKRKPLTREDVLKKIEDNDGTAEGLDLSGKVFEEGIDLRGLNLSKVILKDAILPTNLKSEKIKIVDLRGIHLEKADLTGAHLEGAELDDTHLEGAILRNAHLEGVQLWDTHLEDANLINAHFKGVSLIRTKFSPDVHLEDVDWGNYILDEEKPGFFDSAVASYRHLKVWYTNAGYSDIAAKFYYREKEARRKGLKWCWKRLFFRHRLALEASYWVFGHGEGWKRILLWIAGFILLFGFIYFVISSVWEWGAFWRSLYFSAVSFTALGYGNWITKEWIDVSNDWIKGIGAFESIVGISTMGLLLVTLVRKWTR